MIQLRWKRVQFGNWGDGLEGIDGAETVLSRPVLQYRIRSNEIEIGVQEPIWSEWFDVPTEVIDWDD